MSTLYIALGVIALVVILFAIFSKGKESEDAEDAQNYAPRVIPVKGLHGSKRLFSAKLRSGRNGHDREDFDFFDDFGSLILDEMLMDLLYHSMETGEDFDYSVGSWEDAPAPEGDPSGDDLEAVVEDEFVGDEVVEEILTDVITDEVSESVYESPVREESVYVAPVETYEAPEPASTSYASSCSSEDTSSSSASSCSSSSDSGSSCGSSCGGD
jgi:hypothetical protein